MGEQPKQLRKGLLAPPLDHRRCLRCQKCDHMAMLQLATQASSQNFRIVRCVLTLYGSSESRDFHKSGLPCHCRELTRPVVPGSWQNKTSRSQPNQTRNRRKRNRTKGQGKTNRTRDGERGTGELLPPAAGTHTGCPIPTMPHAHRLPLPPRNCGTSSHSIP